MTASPGSVLMLLLAIYLLLAYFTGRLEWLFSLARDTSAGYRSGQTAPAAAPGSPAYNPTRRSPAVAYA